MADPEPRRSYTLRQPPVQLVCGMCKAAFSRPAWRVRQAARTGATLRCSYACAAAARRVHTPETKAEYHRAYREKNREWINEKQNAARFGPARKHILERDREGYCRNVDKNRERAREYAFAHKEEARARRKAWPAQNPERALFHQARSNISQGACIPARDIPDELVEAKVAQLKVQRAIRDSGRLPEGGDGTAPCEASQSGAAISGNRPTSVPQSNVSMKGVW